jgi:DNA topoisomerase-1
MAKNKSLVIVESPTKAKTISRFLGGDFNIVSSYGHLRDLPKSNKAAIDIKSGFIPHYEISPDKKEIVASLIKLAKNSKEILLATDPDREGEAISWHIAEILGLDAEKTKRVVFHEITESAIKEAIASPRKIDLNLKVAQEARRVLDRIVGYDLSGLIWKKVRYGLSAGRVQSPALRIIMEKEREIRKFKPETFWIITASLKTKKGDFLTLTGAEEPRDNKLVADILTKGQAGNWLITEVKETTQKRAARPPFITSTLQQTASGRFGFTPSRTMRIAQKLYEAGLITYMRTDSTNLSAEAIARMKEVIGTEFGPEFFQEKHYKSGRQTLPLNPVAKAIRKNSIILSGSGPWPLK